jgi:OOP family OmpA-OmpF porin
VNADRATDGIVARNDAAREIALRIHRPQRLASVLLASLLLLASASASGAADVSGSKDHPLISRYPGSVITWQDRQEFEPYRIAVGPVTGYRQIDDWKKVEGRVTRTNYVLSGERSFYEVYSNYLSAVKKAGFTVLAEGADKSSSPRGALGQRGFLQVAFGANPFPPEASTLLAGSATSGGSGYFAAELMREQGPAWIVVGAAQYSQDRIVVVVDIIEGRPMEQDLVVVDAAAMAKGIDADGRIALYGIYFEHDKTDLTAASTPTLEEIAKLLASRPSLKAYLVGHTDSVGNLDYNLRLSAGRAAAVVDALVRNHGVARGRLEPHGVGPLAPVASNSSDPGRAKNRRVELVERQGP